MHLDVFSCFIKVCDILFFTHNQQIRNMTTLPIPQEYSELLNLPDAFIHLIRRPFSDFKFKSSNSDKCSFYVQLRSEFVQQYCEINWPALQRHWKLCLLSCDLFVLVVVWETIHGLPLGRLSYTLWSVCLLLGSSRFSFLVEGLYHLFAPWVYQFMIHFRKNKSLTTVSLVKTWLRDPCDDLNPADPVDSADPADPATKSRNIYIQRQWKRTEKDTNTWNRIVECSLQFLGFPSPRHSSLRNQPLNWWQPLLVQDGSTLLYHALTQPNTFLPLFNGISQYILQFLLHMLLVPLYLEIILSFSPSGLFFWIRLVTLFFFGFELFEFQRKFTQHLERMWDDVHRCAQEHRIQQIWSGNMGIESLEGKRKHDIISVSECNQVGKVLEQFFLEQLAVIVFMYMRPSLVFDTWLEIPELGESNQYISIFLFNSTGILMIPRMDLYNPWRLNYKRTNKKDPSFYFLPDLSDMID